jgi:hypothetical protein
LSVAVTDRGTNNVSGRALFDDGKRLALGSGTYTGMAIMSLSTSSISTIDTLNLHNESAGENTEGGTKLTFSGYGPTNGQGDWRFAGIAGVYDTTSNGLRAGDWGGKLKFFVNRGSSATDFEDAMTITGGGNIAIGKTSASTRLDVSGSVFVTGSLNVSSGITGSLFGTASYANNGTKTYNQATPLNNQPPTSSFATLDTRNAIAVLDFDDGATNESSIFLFVLPENANVSSGLKVRIHWMATSATSGNCRWGAQLADLSDQDIDSYAFDTATEVSTATSGTSGNVTVTEITCTSIDAITAGKPYAIKVYRDSSDTTNDTMTGDAELIAVEVRGAF